VKTWTAATLAFVLIAGFKGATRCEARAASAFAPTVANNSPALGSAPEGMVWIPGGEFSMGAEDQRGMPGGGMQSMDDSRPIHRVYVDGFWMDATDVTNEQFASFSKRPDT
jgi:formylglycine-generating enzyme